MQFSSLFIIHINLQHLHQCVNQHHQHQRCQWRHQYLPIWRSRPPSHSHAALDFNISVNFNVYARPTSSAEQNSTGTAVENLRQNSPTSCECFIMKPPPLLLAPIHADHHPPHVYHLCCYNRPLILLGSAIPHPTPLFSGKSVAASAAAKTKG